MSTNENRIEKFLSTYNKVFDTDGNVRVCGRDLCEQLIEISDKIENKVKHGNIKTGQMNVESIKRLRERL